MQIRGLCAWGIQQPTGPDRTRNELTQNLVRPVLANSGERGCASAPRQLIAAAANSSPFPALDLKRVWLPGPTIVRPTGWTLSLCLSVVGCHPPFRGECRHGASLLLEIALRPTRVGFTLDARCSGTALGRVHGPTGHAGMKYRVSSAGTFCNHGSTALPSPVSSAAEPGPGPISWQTACLAAGW